MQTESNSSGNDSMWQCRHCGRYVSEGCSTAVGPPPDGCTCQAQESNSSELGTCEICREEGLHLAADEAVGRCAGIECGRQLCENHTQHCDCRIYHRPHAYCRHCRCPCGRTGSRGGSEAEAGGRRIRGRWVPPRRSRGGRWVYAWRGAECSQCQTTCNIYFEAERGGRLCRGCRPFETAADLPPVPDRRMEHRIRNGNRREAEARIRSMRSCIEEDCRAAECTRREVPRTRTGGETRGGAPGAMQHAGTGEPRGPQARRGRAESSQRPAASRVQPMPGRMYPLAEASEWLRQQEAIEASLQPDAHPPLADIVRAAGPPEERGRCQCRCGCMQRPGQRRVCGAGREDGRGCGRLIGPGCRSGCWRGDSIKLCHVCDEGNPQESEGGTCEGQDEQAARANNASSAEEEDEVVNIADIVGLMQTIAEWADFEAEERG